MKLQKETVGVAGLDANSMRKYARLSVTVGDGSKVERTEATYDDGTKNIRTNVPVIHDGEATHISFGKTNINRLIDALGDETDTWTGAEIDLIVVEYASLGKQGFDIEAIREPSKKQPAPKIQTPAELALDLIKSMDGGKGAPVKGVATALQVATGISAEAVDTVILGLKNEGLIIEGKTGMLKAV